MLQLRLHTSDTELAELLYISIKARPRISIVNQFQCFVLTKVSDKNVMIILENICVEITSGWYIDSIIKKEKTIGVHRLLAICKDVFCSNWITKKSQKDVLVQSVQINNYSCMKKQKEQESSLYRGHKLFLSEDWLEVVRVDYGIASITLKRVNILLSSESIQFGIKMTRIESDNKIELREILGLLYLPLGQHLGSRKVLKIFMIHNNTNRISQTLQIVLLNFESLKNGQ